MPTIKARRQANGITRYTAIVRIRRGGAILHRESRTFTHRSAALSWAKHREVALEDPSALTRAQHGAPTLADLIRWYIETFETISKWQRSKQTHLEFLERHSLGKTNALKLTSAALIDHVRSRRADGAGPATVANDLVWIGVVLRAAKNVKELTVRPEIVQEARSACVELRLIGKPRKRARRPTSDELAQLREHFARRDQRSVVFSTDTQQRSPLPAAVVDQLRAKFPELADLMGEAEADVLAFVSFPKAHRTQIHSTNPLERLNAEIKRRTDVVGIFPK